MQALMAQINVPPHFAIVTDWAKLCLSANKDYLYHYRRHNL